MASLLQTSLRTRPLLSTLGLFSVCAVPFAMTRSSIVHRLDSSSATNPSWSFSQYQRDAKTPVATSGGKLNPAAIRQISLGSVLGVLVGMGISTFSGSLTLLTGLLIAGVQAAEYYNIHLIPYKRLQNYVSGVDLRSALQDNVAFKLSFGATLALTGFASFTDYA